ncbi:MAG: membrane fusion protein (multidrug efflux system) [Halioglobus sp.]
MSIFSIFSGSAIAVQLLLFGLTHSLIALSNDAVPVEVILVQELPINQTVQLTGTVTSARSARLSASIAGLVTALLVDAGSSVGAGDKLLEMDAELAKWEWQGAQASVISTQLGLSDAQRRLAEVQALAPKQSIAETVVRDLAAEVAEDEAALQRAQADAGYRKGVLDRHVLRAPFAGVISVKQTELGEWISPGVSVLELVATEDLQIDFQVSEDYLSAIGPDTTLTYTLGDSMKIPQRGKIVTFVPIADPSARTFLLRVKPSEVSQTISPGMSARAALHLDSGRIGMVVPRDAVIKYPDGRVVVWVVEASDAGDVVAEKRVDTGVIFDGMVEIRQGLAANARAVVFGNENLQPGQRVLVLANKQD